MIDLAELRAAAEAATSGDWLEGAFADYPEDDARFIALANPETVKALVAVVEAAQLLDEADYVDVQLAGFRAVSAALAPFRGET